MPKTRKSIHQQQVEAGAFWKSITQHNRAKENPMPTKRSSLYAQAIIDLLKKPTGKTLTWDEALKVEETMRTSSPTLDGLDKREFNQLAVAAYQVAFKVRLQPKKKAKLATAKYAQIVLFVVQRLDGLPKADMTKTERAIADKLIANDLGKFHVRHPDDGEEFKSAV